MTVYTCSPLQGYHAALNSPVPIYKYTPGWREAMRAKCLAQEQNGITLAMAQIRTTQPGIQHDKH